MSDDDMIRRGDAIAAAEENRAFGPASIINALRTIPAVQVVVKPLEWRKVAPYGLHEAYGLCWKYQVREGTDGIIRWQAGHMGTWFEVATVESAKAAAQADYEARIRSALIAVPSPDVAGLVGALQSALNFIQNTESEMGVILGCGDKARAALASLKGGAA